MREALEACRKSDLVEMAEHLDLRGTRTMAKKDLKETVIAALENLNLLPAKGTGDLPVLSPCADDAAGHENGAGPSTAAPEETAPGYQTPPALSKTPSSPLTLPKSDPVSPASTPSSLERFNLRLKVRLAQLKYEAEEQEKRRQMEMELEIRRMDLEADTQIKLKRLELEAHAWRQTEISKRNEPHVETHKDVKEPEATRGETTPGIRQRLDISKCIVLVPPFREFEVDSYFQIFERIAAAFEWPCDVWALILQCKLTGKAQEVMSSLSLSDSLDYECVKSAVLTAYELVPEAYRQRFQALTNKKPHQTFVEFAREKLLLFEKWVAASKVSSFTELKELILLEEFKRCSPERTVLYLNEQKVATLSSAALLADEYSLTHRVSGELPPRDTRRPPTMRPAHTGSVNVNQPRCVYCHRLGHVVKDCYKLKRKNEQKNSLSREVGFIMENKQLVTEINDCFQPFLSKGVVQTNESSPDQAPVIILLDTGASQTLISSGVMTFNESSATGVSVLLTGINGEPISQPLHRIFLSCDLARGYFDVAVCPTLPIAGVTLLLGNDVAGGNVVPPFQVLNDPCSDTISCVKEQPGIYPACVITRAQARKQEETLQLSSFFDDGHNKEDNHVHDHNVDITADTEDEGVSLTSGCLHLPRLTLGEEQRRDDSLNKCFQDIKNPDGEKSGYFLRNDVLMRFWNNPAAKGAPWGTFNQIVIPTRYRNKVVSLAHESQWAGHLGIRKMYQIILEHFFWPGMKRDVAEYCKRCHVCQISGKPNQLPAPASLHPIHVIGNPFDTIVVDCVVPLPRSKSGKKYLLTIMCTSTHFPEVFPLSTITAKTVTRILTQYFSLFGLPRVLQTDQGTNFKSELFRKVAQTLGIHHVVSSAYHLESQGALERWHQTFKSMLKKYCLSSGNQWDEGVPFLLFAAREAPQDSLGFSPAQLVFRHTPRGPLKALKEQFLRVPESKKEKNRSIPQEISVAYKTCK
uniref:Gypsy retrotransposon integrase-like protein 1 n=1 Tax=Nothobranchius furzeri TaxID=105023 RepID=A0A8C6KSI9_NOTFU